MNTQLKGMYLFMTVLACIGIVSSTAPGETIYWNGGTGNWDDLTKWSTDPDNPTPNPASKPGADDDVVVARTNVNSTINLTGDEAARSLTTSLRKSVTIQGSGGTRILTLGPGGIDSGTDVLNLTIATSIDLRLEGSQIWTWRHAAVGSYYLNVNAPVSRIAGDTDDRILVLSLLKVSGTIAGNITDGGAAGTLGVWKNLSQTVTLSGNNTYSGGTFLGANSMTTYLTVSTPSALSAAGPLRLRHGTLNLSGASATYAHGDIRIGPGFVELQMPATSTFNMGTLARTIGAMLRINALAGQTYTLANTNVNGILAPWAVHNAGDFLTVGAGNALEICSPTVIASINDLTDSTVNYSYSLTGTHTLTGHRSANTILNTAASAVTIQLGNYDLTLNGYSSRAPSTSTASSFNTTGGRIVIGASGELVFTGHQGYNINVSIVGSGRLVFGAWGGANSRFMTLSQANEHDGGTFFAGVGQELRINHASALGTGPLIIAGISPSINNSSGAAITLTTDNPQIWSKDFTFTGTRNLNMGTGAVSLDDGVDWEQTRTVTVSANTLTIGGSISDGTHAILPTTRLAKAGAGTLELTGASTFSGATTVSAGTLTFGSSASVASTNIIIASGATLTLAGSETFPDTAEVTIDGIMSLAVDVVEVVDALTLGGIEQQRKRTYGSTSSTAMIQNDTYFSGTGILQVGPLSRRTLFYMR